MSKNLLDLYTDFLISSFSRTTATGLSSILGGSLSHDQITTFLAESKLDSKSLWLHVKPMVRELEKAKGNGVLIFDDSIAAKPFSEENEIICYHFDHAKKRHIKGINFLSCLFEKDGVRLPIAAEIIEKDEYFIEKKLYPNVDFYSGIILKAIGFPTSMFTVLFAIGRTIGWVSQWKEMIEDPINKIGRPRQLYTGKKAREYKKVDAREKKSIFNWLWKK